MGWHSPRTRGTPRSLEPEIEEEQLYSAATIKLVEITAIPYWVHIF
jgi:hypothetical protein